MSTSLDWLAEQFEQNRTYLRQISYRLLGSRADAEDAVQEAWLRLSRSDADSIRNLSAWLTTVVSRICLDRLRQRVTHAEELVGVGVPQLTLTSEASDGTDPFEGSVRQAAGVAAEDPADQAVLADSVGLALIVVLDTLSPTERVAFVLHDLFGLPFDEIAHLLDTSTGAARQLASRARRRVRDAEPQRPAPPPRVQRSLVEAFFAAARNGDFDSLLDLLHPDAVLRADGGGRQPSASAIVRGRQAVARRATMFDRPGATLLPAIANGLPAVVVVQASAAVSVMVFTLTGTTSAQVRIRRVDVLLDSERLAGIDPAVLATARDPGSADAGPEDWTATIVI